MSGYFEKLHHAMIRKKNIGADVMNTELKRCLNTCDVTLLGIGHMVGAGIYVLTGVVIKVCVVYVRLTGEIYRHYNEDQHV